MNALTKTDLNFVLTRTPKDILQLMKELSGKLFMAGGFIRSTIAGEKVSDVDLFGPSKELLLETAKSLTISRKGRYFQTDNAITVLASPRHPVQLITRWLFTDPQALIETFDFTVCQAVIWCERIDISHGTCGSEYKWHSACSPTFYSDLAARRLVYTHPKREEESGGSLLRAFKFVKRGWNIQAPSIAGVAARLTIKIDEDAIRASMKISGETKEKIIAQVFTGLLRQVDPLHVIDGVDLAMDEHEVIQP